MSDLPLCLDDFMVTLPYSLVTSLYSLQLGLRPVAAPISAAGGSDFLLDPLLCSSNGHILSVLTSETIPRDWFQIGMGCILPWLILGRLITTVIGVVHTVIFFSTPRGNCVIVGHHQQCFRQFPFTLWSAVPTADIGLCGFSMGPLAKLIVRCTVWGVIPLFVQEIDDEPDGWVPDWRCWQMECPTWEEGEEVDPQFDAQGCFWRLGLVSPEPVVYWQPWGHPLLVAWWQPVPHSYNIWESHQDWQQWRCTREVA